MVSKIVAALQSVDWNLNVQAFCNEGAVPAHVQACNVRIAHWAGQFEQIYKGNPALSFVRDMQVSGHHAACLLALALYKPAAAAMRGMLESALYFTYFHSHQVELQTLARNADYYIDKREVLDFHKRHTANFVESQQVIGLVARLNRWYGTTSAIVHGQLPGVWVQSSSVAGIVQDSRTLGLATKHFVEGEDIVNRLLICAVGKNVWGFLSPESKRVIVKGLNAKIKTALSLDVA